MASFHMVLQRIGVNTLQNGPVMHCCRWKFEVNESSWSYMLFKSMRGQTGPEMYWCKWQLLMVLKCIERCLLVGFLVSISY